MCTNTIDRRETNDDDTDHHHLSLTAVGAPRNLFSSYNTS